MLSQLVDLAFTAAGTSLSIDDFGNILRDVLTSWVPVVLEQSDGPDTPGVELADLSLDLEETVTAVLDALDGTDRTVLRIKLAGAPDSELATVLSVGRPTAAKRKSETFDAARRDDRPPGYRSPGGRTGRDTPRRCLRHPFDEQAPEPGSPLRRHGRCGRLLPGHAGRNRD
ncbi:MAG: hypothetical protein ACRDSZ_14335 [Pseudonocardiaceae bacterium]